MIWKRILFLSCFTAFVLLSILEDGEGAAVGSRQAAGEGDKENLKKKIFLQDSEASSFFKKRGKRSTKSLDELNVENRQQLRADEHRREYYEERRNEFENFVEEQNDGWVSSLLIKQEERSREQIEQWRQWHYDGLYPPYLYNRHHI